jgi:cation diffusion facilitator family transporter
MKLLAGVISGSVSIISEAIHSLMDLVASIIAYFSVKVSDNPPDSRHPYGHGKIENISGVIEAVLIFIAAVWIIVEAIKKLTGGPYEIQSMGVGSAVMLISAVINFFVSRMLYRVARETNSVALEADALHLKTDVYTSLGVAVGLGLIIITGIHWLDPIVAIMVAILIIQESFVMLRKAFLPLIDEAWADNEIKVLESSLRELNVSYHELRTRKAGNYMFLDLHLEIPKDQSVENAHKYCDMVEEALTQKFEKLNVTIHVEPR